mgnify:CR=1 FL=1
MDEPFSSYAITLKAKKYLNEETVICSPGFHLAGL